MRRNECRSRWIAWRNFQSFLETRGYRVIVPALRHHDGTSGGVHPALGRSSIADYFADPVQETDKHGEKPFVIGHSMGGLPAHMLAARGLVRAVVGRAAAAAPIARRHALWRAEPGANARAGRTLFGLPA
ncbi:alpha/beta fold hydrolase [Parvibaculum sp.]|uniref:alpha/beta fold hydrolase n=1 Tax=Parvibaculum sp. TaxID=2024848 RepID=UPI00391CCA9E